MILKKYVQSHSSQQCEGEKSSSQNNCTPGYFDGYLYTHTHTNSIDIDGSKCWKFASDAVSCSNAKFKQKKIKIRI